MDSCTTNTFILNCWICKSNTFELVDSNDYHSLLESKNKSTTKTNIDFIIPENSICKNCFVINFKKCNRCDTLTSISDCGMCSQCFPKFYPCIGCRKNDYYPVSVKRSVNVSLDQNDCKTINVSSFFHKFLRKCSSCCSCKRCNVKIDVDEYNFIYEDEPCLFDVKYDTEKKQWFADDICNTCKTDYDSDDSVEEITPDTIKALRKLKRKQNEVPLKYKQDTTLYRDSCDSDNEEKPKKQINKVDNSCSIIEDLTSAIENIRVEGEYSLDGLKQMKREDLIVIAKNKKLKNYSKLTKDKLIELILKK